MHVTLIETKTHHDEKHNCWVYKLKFLNGGNAHITVTGDAQTRAQMRKSIEEIKELLGCSK